MRCFLIILLFSSLSFVGQDLILDPSFEDTLYCPQGHDLVLKDWYKTNSSTPDTYCSCYPPDSTLSPPYQDKTAFDGDCFIGLVLHQPVSGQNDPREYVEVELEAKLVKGKEYCLSFRTVLSTNSNFAISNIHIGFKEDSMFEPTAGKIDVDTFFRFLTSPLLDSVNWTLLSIKFIASGTERYLTIGNFDKVEDMVVYDFNAQFTPPYLDNYSYYFFDKITLEECKPPQENHFTVYPNPSNGNAIYIDHYSDTHSEVYLYNSLGQVVGYKQLSSGIYEGEIFNNLSAGVYLLRYQTAAGYREVEKVIVVK